MVILDPFLVCVAFWGFLPIMMRFSSFFVQSFLEFRCYLLQCRLEHSREEHRPQVSSKHRKKRKVRKYPINKPRRFICRRCCSIPLCDEGTLLHLNDPGTVVIHRLAT